MEFNDLIFPNPTPTYGKDLDGLYFIPKYKHSRYTTINKEMKKHSTCIKVEVQQEHPTTQIDNIVTIYQCQDYTKNGVIVFFHGNAEDLGMCKSFAFILSMELQLATICMEYPGYGIYQGKSSSDILIRNAHQVIDHIKTQLNVPEQNIIIIGRSIGTGIAVEMAIKYQKIQALVLLSPFTSLCDVIKDCSFEWIGRLVKERFRNLEKMQNIQCPTLIIHGRDDKLIPYNHSIKLMHAHSGITDLQIFEGMTHNSFILQIHVLQPLKNFLQKIS